MSGQDDIDTARVVMLPNSRCVSQSVVLNPGERREVVLDPADVMVTPVLTLATDDEGDDVSVEQVACGPFVVLSCLNRASDFTKGHIVDDRVSSADPLRILLNNQGTREHKITATLSVTERAGAYSIVHDRDKGR